MSDEAPWIEWTGGVDCPIPSGAAHEVKFRDGDIFDDVEPETWDWTHCGCNEDIVAYRLIGAVG